jgi:hypothetical protein
MMPITHVVDVYRLEAADDTETYGTDPVHEAVPFTIFPANAELVAMYPGEYCGQLYQVATEQDIDLKNGDKLIAGGQTIIVRGVPTRYAVYGHIHIECMAVEKVGT